ncbi:hypothetical protein AB46_1133 [Escherichia coli 3-267-03_S1_C2]|nr:hypothetical protein HMPREF9534_00617 [Escherichia coli MS 69-1]ESD91422.1 hypothetical protein HMPREF1611_00078 [Escherichia coli 908573]KDU05221.1 hypothetical protein AB46_1133 [Escherichia coli 3-267-03_S1_C2]KEJ75909.1 hypothetical protein AB67_2137 [Escherichia coli 5-366-08_S1_C3]KEL68354.1 hypothetical protein AB08_3295 [Escherichia coli 5-366-08_S1_C1]
MRDVFFLTSQQAALPGVEFLKWCNNHNSKMWKMRVIHFAINYHCAH